MLYKSLHNTAGINVQRGINGMIFELLHNEADRIVAEQLHAALQHKVAVTVSTARQNVPS